MNDDSRIIPVILSGGAGTRLWPLSSKDTPKQFLPLAGDRTMLQETALRVRDSELFAPPLLIGSDRHASLLAEQLAQVDAPPSAMILEPSARNTAPAIALAALAAEPDRLLLVMPSDHVVGDPDAFLRVVEAARPIAREEWLVTFGIRPTRAETGFGYIHRGETLAPGVHRVERFVEKPDAATAQGYIDEGCYDWNSGIFMFRAVRYLAALAAHAPEIHAAACRAMANASRDAVRICPDSDAFAASPSDSIDWAVMEKDDRVAVVPVEMGWSDIGSWDALYELSAPNENNNVVSGPARLIDSRNCLAYSMGPEVVTVGVQNLIVIATPESILILPRGESQRVREALPPK